MSGISELPPLELDRASNANLFAKLATPHMLDLHRLEEVRRHNENPPPQLGRQGAAHVSMIRDGDALPAKSSAEESVASLVHDELPAIGSEIEMDAESETLQPMNDAESSASSFGAAAAPELPPKFTTPSFTPSFVPSFAPSAASSIPAFARSRHTTPSPAPEGVWATKQASPSPPPRQFSASHSVASDTRSQFNAELERIRAAASGPRQAPRQHHPHHSMGSKQSFASVYEKMRRERLSTPHHGFGGGSGSSANLAPHEDPDFAEKRELLIKLDELRELKMSIPQYDIRTPLSDLQAEMARRTMSMGIMSTVEMYINGIEMVISGMEVLNTSLGPWLPMTEYTVKVREGTATPRFRYAMYQIVLSMKGRSGMSPMWIVMSVLLLPLIQVIIVAVVRYFVKSRKWSVSSSTVSGTVDTLMSFFKPDPKEGVPAGIPGISPDMTNDAPPPNPFNSMPTSSSSSGVTVETVDEDFNSQYPRVDDPPAPHSGEATAAAETNQQPSTAARPVRRRKRLRRPNEPEPGDGFVVTPNQMK